MLDASLHELGEMGEPAGYDRRGIRFYANQLRAAGDSDIVSPAGFRSHYRRPARSHLDDPSRAKVSDQGVIEVRIHCHIGTVDQPKAVRVLCWLFDRIDFSELGEIGREVAAGTVETGIGVNRDAGELGSARPIIRRQTVGVGKRPIEMLFQQIVPVLPEQWIERVWQSDIAQLLHQQATG